MYPYKYINSFKKFNEDKLPDKCEFFSSLKDKCISKEEYDRAIHVWNVFKIKTLGEYQDLHLKTDVSLLADEFEKFIKTCLGLKSIIKTLWIRSLSLYQCTWIKLGRNVKND